MKIISIANQKGGCGKTTTAINLASALSINGKRVLLLDLDPQAHASLGLNIDGQNSIYNVISNLTPNKLKIADIIQRVENSFDIIPSHILVGTLEQELADEIGRELKLIKTLESVKQEYDYILIDCPPSLGILTINAIRASEELIIPVETSRFSVYGVEHLLDVVHLIDDRLNHRVKSRVLVTMFDSRLRHSFSMLATIKERFGSMLFDSIIHINVKLKESAVMGQTVNAFDKYCRGAKDYFTLAKEILCLDQVIKESIASFSESFNWPGFNRKISAVENFSQELPPVSLSESIARADDLVSGFSPKMQELVVGETQKFLRKKFVLKAPAANSVYVTGSFNNWALDESCRMKENDGMWEVEIPLKLGTYRYQFIVDGVWRDDLINDRKERNSFGDINSILEITDEQPIQQ